MYLGAPKAAREYGKRCPRTRGAVRPRPLPKLCQELRRRPPTLANATDAKTQHFQRLPTPTNARTSLPKQVRYQTAPRPETLIFGSSPVCVRSV